MKYPTVNTQFVSDIITDLEIMAYNLGWAKNGDADFHLSQDLLFDHLEWAFELCQADIKYWTNAINELDENCDPSDYNELKQCIESTDKLVVDLSILADLESADYANPNCIFLSIETISERLSSQLEGKANGEAYYNEYYCKKLAEVLSELCEIIKEA